MYKQIIILIQLPMNNLLTTRTKANITERIQLIIFTTIMIMLGNLVVAWANNGFATYF